MSDIVESNEAFEELPLWFEDAEEELRTVLMLRLARDKRDQLGAAIRIIIEKSSLPEIAAIASIIWLNAVALRVFEIYAERIEDPTTGEQKIDMKPEVVGNIIRSTQTCDKATLVEVIVKAMLTMFTVENARCIFLSFFERNRDMFRTGEITFAVPMISDRDKRTADDLVKGIAEELRKKSDKSLYENIQVILKNSETH